MKKILDIAPPKKISPSTIGLKQEKNPVLVSLPKKKFILVGAAILIFCCFCYFSLSSAKIEIWPETRILDFKETVVINGNDSESNFSKNIIPGKILKVEKEVSQQFEATGSVLKKAKGVIRIYNAYSTSAQALVATTRFVSASGKLFRTPKKIVVPGGHYEKGKLVPGYIDIEVIADQAGEDYNIEPTTFSIPGFAGHAKYTFFYAKSFSKLSGGGRFAKVTQEDLDRARDTLSEKVKAETEKEIREIIEKGNFVLLDNVISQEITDASSLAIAGAEVEEFSYKVKGFSTALVFLDADLENFAEHFIASQISDESLPKHEKLHLPSLEKNYLFNSMDFENNKMNLVLSFSGKVYSDIDTAALKKALTEKSFEETKILLENEPKISKIQFELWPFWVKKVPSDLDKIHINLNLD